MRWSSGKCEHQRTPRQVSSARAKMATVGAEAPDFARLKEIIIKWAGPACACPAFHLTVCQMGERPRPTRHLNMHCGGSPPLSDFGRLYQSSQPRGRGLMTRKVLRLVALLGTTAAMLTVTIVLTHTHATVSMSGVGILKCYATAGTQKACWIWRVRRSGDVALMNERLHAVTHHAGK